MLNGRIGQVIGPFDQGVDLLSNEGAIGAFTPETTRPILTKIGIQADKGTTFKINDASLRIGKTGIYELDNVVEIKSLIFTSATNENTLIDFVY
jgi:hypothetical protein